MKPSIPHRRHPALHHTSRMRAWHALKSRPSPKSSQVWQLSARGCGPRHSQGSSPLGDPWGGATWHEGTLLDTTLVGDWQNRLVGQSGQPSAHGVPELVLALLCSERKHPAWAHTTRVECSFSLVRRKRSRPWAQISIKITITMMAHSFSSRQGLPHFILSRWPSSRRVNGLFCNSHLTPENEDRPYHSYWVCLCLIYR